MGLLDLCVNGLTNILNGPTFVNPAEPRHAPPHLRPPLRRRTVLAAGLGAAAAALAPRFARAQEPWPGKPIKILVGAGAGGTTDITAPVSSARRWRSCSASPSVIENRPGAAGTLSMQQTVRAPADGYTLVWVGNSVMAIAPYLYKNPATTRRR